MAAVPITIVGSLADGENTKNVTITGLASLTGLEVGGGPITRPPGDHIWGGGNVPMPTPPIANVPGAPGYRPPGDHIWGGGNEPFPTPPIHIPPGKPEEPVQPPVNWKPVWLPPAITGGDGSWVIVGIPSGDHVAPSGE